MKTEIQSQQFMLIRDVFGEDEVNEFNAWFCAEKKVAIEALTNKLGLSSPNAALSFVRDLSLAEGDKAKLDRETKLLATGFLTAEARLSDYLRGFIVNSKLPEVAADVLRDPSPRMHFPPIPRYVLPGTSVGLIKPHQDVSYNRHLSDFLVAWVPFVEITERCGGINVYPEASSASEVMEGSGTTEWLYLPPIEVSEKDALHIEMNPGDMLLMSKWLVHASRPNTSSMDRVSLSMRLFPGSVETEKPYMDLGSGKVINSY